MIDAIEKQTNYRDFNIQIINRYFDAEYEMEKLDCFKICAPKSYVILQKMQMIKETSEEEFVDAKN